MTQAGHFGDHDHTSVASLRRCPTSNGIGAPLHRNTHQTQQEALRRAINHAQSLRMETGALPPEIRHVVKLLCRAQESLIEAQQKALHPPERWDTNGNFSARERLNLNNQAVHQLAEALNELKDAAGPFIDTTAEHAD